MHAGFPGMSGDSPSVGGDTSVCLASSPEVQDVTGRKAWAGEEVLLGVLEEGQGEPPMF